MEVIAYLFERSLQWAIDFIPKRRQVEGPTEPSQSTSSDSQLAEARPEMAPIRQKDNAKRLKGPSNERREELPRTTKPGYGREDKSALYSRQEKRINELEDSNRRLSDAHQGVLTELDETQVKCKKQHEAINSLREKLRDASDLLDARNRELKVAKSFLSKEDPVCISDVVQAVRDLNSEVMQTAACLADNLALKRVRGYPVEGIPEGPYKSIFVTLFLPQRSGDEVSAELLELAIQGFLVVWVGYIANTWGFFEGSAWFGEFYSKVCENEDPAVASNWRALTRRTLFNIDSSQVDLPCRVVNDAILQLASHLSHCGIGESYHNGKSIHKHAAEKFGSLFATAQKLNKIIGEKIVSCDLTVATIGGGHLFNAEDMEEAYPRVRAKPGKRVVICTTGLGLYERGSKMLLKPKVLLHDV